MRCFVTDGHGIENLKIEIRPDPDQIGPYEVEVEVKAVALNYRDILVAKGLYLSKTKGSFIACSDMSGIVKKVGAQVKQFKPGDHVINSPFKFWPAGNLKYEWAKTFVGGAGVDGMLAEKIVYPAISLVKAPSNLDFQEACTLPIAGLTAWAALVTHGKALPGEWVLLQGTGGVSIFAAQIAQRLRLNAILTTSSTAKGSFVKDNFGIKSIVNYQHQEWPEEVKKLTPDHGVDLVVEVAGGDSLGNSLRACRYGARLALIGLLDGIESHINVVDILRYQISIRGIYMESTEVLETFARAVEAWNIKPYIDKSFPFEEAIEAYQYLQSQKHIGKVVIKVS